MTEGCVSRSLAISRVRLCRELCRELCRPLLSRFLYAISAPTKLATKLTTKFIEIALLCRLETRDVALIASACHVLCVTCLDTTPLGPTICNFQQTICNFQLPSSPLACPASQAWKRGPRGVFPPPTICNFQLPSSPLEQRFFRA